MTTGDSREESDRASDFGVGSAYWNAAHNSTEAGVSLAPPPAVLTPEQAQRRASLRRLVFGIVAGLGALSVAAVIGTVRHRHATPVVASVPAPTLPDTKPGAPIAPAVEAAPLPSVPAVSAPPFDWQAFAAAPAPDAAALSAWQSASKSLDHTQVVRADRELARASGRGALEQREAARLARAMLWRAIGHGRAARRTFAQLAERAKTPVVREDALAELAAK